MSGFDEWFKEKFYDLHESCCCGDLVAIQYKKAIKKTYNEQQKKIDAVLEYLNESPHPLDLSVDHIKELLRCGKTKEKS